MKTIVSVVESSYVDVLIPHYWSELQSLVNILTFIDNQYGLFSYFLVKFPFILLEFLLNSCLFLHKITFVQKFTCKMRHFS